MRVWAGAVLIGLPVWLSGCGSEGNGVNADGFVRSDNPAQIKVFVTTGWCDTLDPPTSTETAERATVEFIVHRADEDEPCESIAPKEHAVDVKLKSPLGEREVRSAGLDTPLFERPETPAP